MRIGIGNGRLFGLVRSPNGDGTDSLRFQGKIDIRERIDFCHFKLSECGFAAVVRKQRLNPRRFLSIATSAELTLASFRCP